MTADVTLPYADLPARWGVAMCYGPDGVRIIVPPVSRWTQLHKGYFVGGTILAILVVLMTAATIQQRDPAGVSSILAYGIGLFAVVMVAANRLRRRLILEVNRRTVFIENTSRLLGGSRGEWPRESVGQIKFNPSNQKLLVRITGQKLVEYFVSPNPEITRWVAEQLDQALRQTEAGPTQAMPVHHDPASGAQTRFGRVALIVVGSTMVVAAVALMILGFPLSILGIYLLIFSAAPFGIALGTREKEYYFL